MKGWSTGGKLGLVILAAAGVVLLYGLLPQGEQPAAPLEEEALPEEPAAPDPSAPPPDDGRVNLLVCGVDETRYLTDVIMLASLEEESGRVSVLQIPRDTYVGSQVPTGKLNAVYGQKDGGIQALEKLVRELLGLPVDYYVTVTLEGVRSIVDDLGGIPMTLEEPIDYLPGKYLAAGEQVLTGQQAEWLVRYREGYATGDIGRLEVQQAFLKAAVQAVYAKGRAEAIAALVRNYSQVETDMPLLTMISLGGKVFDRGAEGISFYRVPGEGRMIGGYAVYLPDQEALRELLDLYFDAVPPREDQEKGAVS
ncbi:MAG TPA: LCP family protein [Firmicutes bacterium]|nr:LCP family protein [Bacillota bacterium]